MVTLTILATDTPAAIQGKLDGAAGEVVRFERAIHTLNDPLLPPSGALLDLGRATLRYAADAPGRALLDLVAVSHVEVVGGIFDGHVAGHSAWDGQRHAVRIRDGQNVHIHGARFINLCGDGIYISRLISAGYVGSTNVWVERCRFIGANANRNGVSVICGRNIDVSDNLRLNIGRPDMPGGIDLEPNDPQEFLREVRVSRNTLLSGAVASKIGISLENSIGAVVHGVDISHNQITGGHETLLLLRGRTGVEMNNVAAVGNQLRGLGVAQAGITVDRTDALVLGNSIEGMNGPCIAEIQTPLVPAKNVLRRCVA